MPHLAWPDVASAIYSKGWSARALLSTGRAELPGGHERPGRLAAGDSEPVRAVVGRR